MVGHFQKGGSWQCFLIVSSYVNHILIIDNFVYFGRLHLLITILEVGKQGHTLRM